MYNILRADKLKDRRKITAAAEHNQRLRTQPNIITKKTGLNRVLYNPLNVDVFKAESLADKIEEKYKDLGVKATKENVLAMEFLVSASPEFFDNLDPTDIIEWANEQVDFFKKEFKENFVHATLHLDEKTPHIHCVCSTEETKEVKYKNRHGSGVKVKTILNANRWNKEFLTELHTKHSLNNVKWGLKRGRAGSGAIHKPVKEHYQEIAKNEAKTAIQAEELERKNALIATYKNKHLKLKEVVMSILESMDELLDILIGKDLTKAELITVNKAKRLLPKKPEVRPKTSGPRKG